MTDPTPSLPQLREQAAHLRLHGLAAHWAELTTQPESLSGWAGKPVSAPAAAWSGA